MLFKALFPLLIFGILIGPMSGQGYNCEPLSVENLLPTNEVYICIADRDGYIWMGTEAGLFRYDGRDLEKISFHSGPTYQSVYEIHEDLQGRLWFYASDGKIRYLDGAELTEVEDEVSRLSSFKMGFYQSADTTVWMGSIREGYYRYHLGQTLEQHQYDVGTISEVYASSSNVLIMVGARGIFKQTLSTGQSELIVNYSHSTIPRTVRDQDTVLIFMNEMISKFQLSTLTEISRDTLNIKENIIHVSKNAAGKIVVGTRNSLYYYDGDHFVDHELTLQLHGHAVSYYHEDQFGNIWISTLDAGIFRFYNPLISQVTATDLFPIKTITEGVNQGDLLVGSNSGRYVDYTNTTVASQQEVDYWAFEGNVKKIIIDEPYTWTLTNHIHEFSDGETNVKASFSARELLYDSDNNVLHIGSLAGAFRFTPEQFIKLSKTRYEDFIQRPELNPSIIYTSEIKDLVLIPSKNTWYVGKKGLANAAQNFEYWGERHLLLNQEFERIETDGKDKLYLLTRNEEILCFDIAQDSVYSILSNQSHCGDMIREIKYDLKNDLIWAACNSAIASIDVNSVEDNIRCYGFSDGLPYATINTMYATDSMLLIGTESGLFSLNTSAPNELRHNIRIDIIGLTSDPKRMDATNEYNIASSENNLLFDALAIGSGQGLVYNYKINDDGWITTEDERVPLDRLTYGTNSIQIQAQSKNGNISQIETVSVVLKKPWFYNPIIWLLGLLTAIILFYSGIVSFNSHVIKEKFIIWLSRFEQPPLKLTIKTTDGSFVNLLVEEIIYVSAAGNYIEIYAAQEKYVSRMTFRSFLDELKQETSLCQIHRSFIVNIDRISEVTLKGVIIDGEEIPYSAKYKSIISPLKKKIHLNTRDNFTKDAIKK